MNQTGMTPTVEQVKSLVPEFIHDNDKKREFLSWRLCGFSVTESCKYINIAVPLYEQWKRNDTEFMQYETLVPQLRPDASKEITRQLKERNTRLFMELEANVLDTSVQSGVDTLSDNEMEVLKGARKFYNPEVDRILGDSDPQQWHEFMLVLKGGSNAKRNQTPEPNNQEHVIEGEHTKSSVESDRPSGNPQKDDPSA